MAEFPLHFAYRDLVPGKDFQAYVEGRGLLLLSVEDGEGVWMNGVTPGGLSACGDSNDEAHNNFRGTYRAILLELASESANLESFKTSVEAFFADTNTPNRDAWNSALERVRRDSITVAGIDKREAAPPSVTVRDLREMEANSSDFAFTVADNRETQLLRAA